MRQIRVEEITKQRSRGVETDIDDGPPHVHANESGHPAALVKGVRRAH